MSLDFLDGPSDTDSILTRIARKLFRAERLTSADSIYLLSLVLDEQARQSPAVPPFGGRGGVVAPLRMIAGVITPGSAS